MNKTLIAAIALASMTGSALAGDVIRVVGSSTVYPFSTAVAEKVGKSGIPTPVVESTGTGGGIKLFCKGKGNDTPDAVNASRKMKDAEVKACADAGVKNPIELKIGRDAIVIANKKGSASLELTLEQVYLALAKQIPVNGKLVDNPNKLWSDIDPSFPKIKIEVYGPPTTSGTRDSFADMALHKGCKPVLEKAGIKLEGDAEKAACTTVREDGAWVDAGENDNLLIQKLEVNPDAFGIFGYSFLEENGDKVQAALINGVQPTYDTAVDGSYPLSRDLFVYIKREHLKSTPGLKEFAKEMVSNGAIGDEGYLTEKGLIAIAESDRKEQQAKLK